MLMKYLTILVTLLISMSTSAQITLFNTDLKMKSVISDSLGEVVLDSLDNPIDFLDSGEVIKILVKYIRSTAAINDKDRSRVRYKIQKLELELFLQKGQHEAWDNIDTNIRREIDQDETNFKLEDDWNQYGKVWVRIYPYNDKILIFDNYKKLKIGHL